MQLIVSEVLSCSDWPLRVELWQVQETPTFDSWRYKASYVYPFSGAARAAAGISNLLAITYQTYHGVKQIRQVHFGIYTAD